MLYNYCILQVLLVIFITALYKTLICFYLFIKVPIYPKIKLIKSIKLNQNNFIATYTGDEHFLQCTTPPFWSGGALPGVEEEF